MIKQAKAGKPVDLDALPPPVFVGAAAQPSAPASSQPAQAAPAKEELGSNNKATTLDRGTNSKPSQHGNVKFTAPLLKGVM